MSEMNGNAGAEVFPQDIWSNEERVVIKSHTFIPYKSFFISLAMGHEQRTDPPS